MENNTEAHVKPVMPSALQLKARPRSFLPRFVGGSIRKLTFIGLLSVLLLLSPIGTATTYTETATLAGVLNGVDIAASNSGSGDDSTGIVSATLSGVSTTEWDLLVAINSIITFICRASALEDSGAQNLYTLTGGNFDIDMTIRWREFPEAVTHLRHHVETTGTTTDVESTIAGTVPTFPSLSSITFSDYTESWTQVVPGHVHAEETNRAFTIAGTTYHYDWISEILYAGTTTLNGNQVRSVTGMTASYDSINDEITYAATNEVALIGGVPTLSELGIMILGGLLVVVGAVRMRRRT